MWAQKAGIRLAKIMLTIKLVFMRLSNSKGDFLELTVAGYQFPSITKDYHDANWLNIIGWASLGGKEWKFFEPCLLTGEVAELTEWLMQKAHGHTTANYICFIEPCIAFECPSDQTIKIWFELEVRPKWAPFDGADTMDLFIEIPNDPNQLKAASESLLEQLVKFPIR